MTDVERTFRPHVIYARLGVSETVTPVLYNLNAVVLVEPYRRADGSGYDSLVTLSTGKEIVFALPPSALVARMYRAAGKSISHIEDQVEAFQRYEVGVRLDALPETDTDGVP